MRPASTSGRTSRMNALAWQPGLAIRLAARIRSRWSARELGQAERPAARGPVCRAGVDEAGARIGDEGDRLACRRVGQAQEGDVGGVQQARTLARILAQLGRGAQHLDIAALGEVLVDAKAGRAFLAVDENAGAHADLESEARAYGRAARRALSDRRRGRGVPGGSRTIAHGDEETQGPRPRPGSPARAARSRSGRGRRRADRRRAPQRRPRSAAARSLPAAHAHRRRRRCTPWPKASGRRA